MINFQDYPPLLTVAELQKLLRIGRGKAYDMIRDEEVPAYKLRGAIRIPRDELLHTLEQQRESQRENARQENADTRTKLAVVPLAKGGEKKG
jgi:excisionase family DNA binding protein